MQVAIYTRVSTERQEREQTIESQVPVLRAWVEAHGHSVRDEHVFQDQGYSGARLDRPGLDRLRDTVQDGDVRAVVVLSPDRLARKYLYQVLLLEEFKRAGCQTLFVHRPIGEDPSDQLLLQIQGRHCRVRAGTAWRAVPPWQAATSAGWPILEQPCAVRVSLHTQGGPA